MTIADTANRLKKQAQSEIRATNAKVGMKNLERQAEGFPPMPNLSMGNPDFPPSAELVSEIAARWQKVAQMNSAEQRSFFAYQSAQSSAKTQKKMVELYNHNYPKAGIDTANVMLFNGATHFVSTVFNISENHIEGETAKVAVFAPYYPSHADQVELAGKEFVPIYVQAGETPATALQRVIDSNRAKNGANLISSLLLSYPSNPTGNYFSREELAGIMDVAANRKNAGMILAVERLYDGVANNPADIPFPLDINPNFYKECPYAEATSFAKSYGMPGSHLAYGFATKELMTVIGPVSQKNLSTVSAEAENTLQTTIDFEISGKLDAWKAEMRKHYMDNVNYLRENMPVGFQKLPMINDERHASFYYPIGAPGWIGKNIPDRVTQINGDSKREVSGIREKLGKQKFENCKDIAKFLLEAEIAAVVPLVPFGVDDPYFRVSCAVNMQDLQRAIGGLSAANKAVATGRDVVLQHKNGEVVSPDFVAITTSSMGTSRYVG